MKIIIDNKIPFIQGVFENTAEVVYKKGAEITNDDLKNAQALITRTRTKCNEKLLKGTPIEFIATATIGFDHIDTDFCKKNNIKWTNAPGCNSFSVQQYMASVFAFLAKKYQFDYSKITLGIVGVGNVGKKIEKLARLLKMNILLNDPPRQRNEGTDNFVSLEKIQRQADIITFHTPLNHEGEDKTFHLFDESFLSKLTQKTIIINSSRGQVVDNKVLKNALIDKKIKAAILDVWENEPEIDIELLKRCDIATPHIAGYSADGKATGTSMSVQAISKHFNLNLDNWQAQNIPLPENIKLLIDCAQKTEQEIILEAMESTYKIIEDDQRLRKNINEFEKQRGNYPLRREAPAYSCQLFNCTENLEQKFKDLRFNILVNSCF